MGKFILYYGGWIIALLFLVFSRHEQTVTVDVKSPGEIAVCYSDHAPKCEHVQIKPKTE